MGLAVTQKASLHEGLTLVAIWSGATEITGGRAGWSKTSGTFDWSPTGIFFALNNAAASYVNCTCE